MRIMKKSKEMKEGREHRGRVLCKNFDVYFLFIITTCMLSWKGWYLIATIRLVLRTKGICQVWK